MPTRESTAWLAHCGAGLAVLRRLDPARYPVDEQTVGEVRWLHMFLVRLHEVGFPAPVPLPLDDRRSWLVWQGAVWELMTYVPGQVIGWRPHPSLVQVGHLLGRYHQASAAIPPGMQRPRSFALDRIVAARYRSGWRRAWLEDLAADLQRIGHDRAPRLVIHGDFTAHNVVATGWPAAPSGVIDFACAYLEAATADIGFGLWRTGRPRQGATSWDLDRVRALVAGYTAIRPLPLAAAEAITVYLRARGIQQGVKAHASHRRSHRLLTPRVQWLREHHDALATTITEAIAHPIRPDLPC